MAGADPGLGGVRALVPEKLEGAGPFPGAHSADGGLAARVRAPDDEAGSGREEVIGLPVGGAARQTTRRWRPTSRYHLGRVFERCLLLLRSLISLVFSKSQDKEGT